MSLADAILARAKSYDLPTGGRGKSIGISEVAHIAREHALSGHLVEAQALRLNVQPTRYLRNQSSISLEQQATLLESTVAQVGLGGLGGSLFEMLLRTGVGTIRGADGDTFEDSNLNRQALSTPADINIPKAETALKRAAEINPSASVECVNDFLTAATFPPFLRGADIAIDALGGLESRLTLQEAASQANIPLVTGALAGWTGYISVVMPGETGPAEIMGSDNGAEEKLGCPAPAVTFFASLMATECVKILSGIQSTITSSMVIVDLQSLSFETIRL